MRAGGADFGAIHHQADVIGAGVFAALLEAIGHGLRAGAMTVHTGFDAHEGFFVELVSMSIGHSAPQFQKPLAESRPQRVALRLFPSHTDSVFLSLNSRDATRRGS